MSVWNRLWLVLLSDWPSERSVDKLIRGQLEQHAYHACVRNCLGRTLASRVP